MRKVMVLATLNFTLVVSMALHAEEWSGTQKQAAAHPVHHRGGFWISGGIGAGTSNLRESDSRFYDSGVAVYLRAGGTVNERLLFGSEVLAWFRDTDGQHFDRVNVTATALFYPKSDAGFFLKGGFGVASSNQFIKHSNGFGTTLGAGFDFHLWKRLSVTPNADVLIQFLDNSADATLLFTLGLTWH